VPIEEDGRHLRGRRVQRLEHIPDDAARCVPFAGCSYRGAWCSWWPRSPERESEFDLAIGHQRRYRRRSLRAAAEAAGSASRCCTT
jgi:hypothetical protein